MSGQPIDGQLKLTAIQVKITLYHLTMENPLLTSTWAEIVHPHSRERGLL